MITKSQLKADFERLGIAAGQTVMLHASVKAIGWILGGPRVVLEALLEVLTPSGTLMMIASWEGNPYEMGEWTEEEQAACSAECPPFDPATSPADWREMGILTEYLRTWPGARRSGHPLASFVAVGAQAQWLTAVHEWQYQHGVESPLGRLCAAGGKVLNVGAPLDTLTLLHHAEQLVDIPNKQVDRYQMPVLQDGRRVWVEIEEYDTTEGIADFGTGDADYFEAIGEAYVTAGRGRAGLVGAAQTYLLEAEDLKQFGMEWMVANYRGANGE